jgi:hypothetical protein
LKLLLKLVLKLFSFFILIKMIKNLREYISHSYNNMIKELIFFNEELKHYLIFQLNFRRFYDWYYQKRKPNQ